MNWSISFTQIETIKNHINKYLVVSVGAITIAIASGSITFRFQTTVRNMNPGKDISSHKNVFVKLSNPLTW